MVRRNLLSFFAFSCATQLPGFRKPVEQMISHNPSNSDCFYRLVLDITYPKPTSEKELERLLNSWKISDKAYTLLDQLRNEGSVLNEEVIPRSDGYQWVLDFNSRFISGVFDGALASSFDEGMMRKQGFVPSLTISKLPKA